MEYRRHFRPSRYVAWLIVGILHVGIIVAIRLEGFRYRQQGSPQNAASSMIFIPLSKTGVVDAPRPAPLRRRPPQTAAREKARSPLPAPLIRPPGEIKPQIDWAREIARAGKSAMAREEQQARYDSAFGLPKQKSAAAPPDHPTDKNFSWSYRTHRVQDADGLMIIWLSERCVLIGGLFPVCHFGKIKARGDLFKHLRPRYLDPENLPAVPKMDVILAVTRYRLKMIADLLSQWRAEKAGYPTNVTELMTSASVDIPQAERRDLLADAWGRTFVYRPPGQHLACGYDLYSVGPDGHDDRGRQDDVITEDQQC